MHASAKASPQKRARNDRAITGADRCLVHTVMVPSLPDTGSRRRDTSRVSLQVEVLPNTQVSTSPRSSPKWPWRPDSHGILPVLVVFAASVLGIGIAAWVVWGQAVANLENNHYAQMEAMADARARAAQGWASERRGDALVLRSAKVLTDPASVGCRPDLQGCTVLDQRLSAFLAAWHYDGILVLDQDGKTLGGVGLEAMTITEPLQKVLERARQESQVLSTGVYALPGATAPRLVYDVVAQLDFSAVSPRAGDERSSEARTLVLRMRADTLFDRILASWPIPSRTAAVALLFPQGQEVIKVTLDPPGRTAGVQQLPAAALSALDQQALTHSRARISAIHTRGQPSLGVTRPLLSGGWVLVATLGHSEIDVELRRAGLWLIAAALLALLTAGAVSLLLVRQRANLQLRERVRAEDQRQSLLEHQGWLFRFASEPMVVLDPQALILDSNPAAAPLFGSSSRAEAADDLLQHLHVDDRQNLLELLDRLRRIPGADVDAAPPRATVEGRLEVRLLPVAESDQAARVADGPATPRYLELQLRAFEPPQHELIKADTLYQAVFHDITDRRIAELGLQRLTRLYQTLSEINQLIVRKPERGTLLLAACEVLVRQTGMERAWIALVNPDRGSTSAEPPALTPMAPADVLPGQIPPLLAEVLRSRSPMRHLGIDPPTLGGRSVPLVRAGAFLPLVDGDTLLGLLGCYAPDEQQFDTEAMRLLGELAADIGLALTAQAREQELLESEARFRATFEQAAVGIAHVGLDGRWLRVNQRLCDLLGYSREQLLATDFQSLTHADDLNGDLERVGAVLQGQIDHYQMQKRYRCGPLRPSRDGGADDDGEYLWALLTVSLRRDGSGRPLHFISVVEDISEIKQAESRLRLAEAVFTGTRDGMVVCDRTQRILSVNPAYTRMTGYAEEEVLGRQPGILKSGQHPQEFYQSMWQRIHADGRWQGSIINQRKDGSLSEHWLSVSAVDDRQGHTQYYLGVMTELGEVPQATPAAPQPDAGRDQPADQIRPPADEA